MKDLISALRGYFPSPTECEKAADELGRKAMQCAVLTVERDELRADLDAERDAAELKSACITGMRQEVTAWSVTAENLEAERDTLKSDAARYQWLTADLDMAHGRVQRNQILDRMPTMSYSAACTAIDAAMKGQS